VLETWVDLPDVHGENPFSLCLPLQARGARLSELSSYFIKLVVSDTGLILTSEVIGYVRRVCAVHVHKCSSHLHGSCQEPPEFGRGSESCYCAILADAKILKSTCTERVPYSCPAVTSSPFGPG
jgi:hypothetical protein